jgi:Na+-transporting methylmalonyl-CoA/oxaloacetate decarboxylase gamma subunit
VDDGFWTLVLGCAVVFAVAFLFVAALLLMLTIGMEVRAP